MKNRKMTGAVLAAIVALGAAAPASDAAPRVADEDLTVCNQATPHSLGGSLDTLPGDPTPPARYVEELNAHPGKGKGLVLAASKSPALQVCGENDVNDGGDIDDPIDDGGNANS